MANGKKNGNGKKTTALAVVGQQEFAILKAEPDKLPELLRTNLGNDDLSVFDLDRIKIPAGGGQAWAIPTIDGEETVKEFFGVIIYHKNSRAYWVDEFTGQGNPPDCSSDNGEMGIGEPGGECLQCPFGRFGSDPKGGKGQACKQLKQLFVIQPGDLLPVVVTLPPTSIRPAKKFLTRLASKGMVSCSVLVKFALEKTRNAGGIEYSRVVLSVAEQLTAEQTERFLQINATLQPYLDKVSVGAEDYVTEDEEAEVPV